MSNKNTVESATMSLLLTQSRKAMQKKGICRIISAFTKNSDPEMLRALQGTCSKLQKNISRILNSKKTSFIGIKLKELPS